MLYQISKLWYIANRKQEIFVAASTVNVAFAFSLQVLYSDAARPLPRAVGAKKKKKKKLGRLVYTGPVESDWNFATGSI